MYILPISIQSNKGLHVSSHGLSRRDSILCWRNEHGIGYNIQESYYPFKDETKDAINSNVKKLIAKNASAKQNSDAANIKTSVDIKSILPFTEAEFNRYKNDSNIPVYIKEHIEKYLRRFYLKHEINTVSAIKKTIL